MATEPGSRIKPTIHADGPWRIGDIATDFDLIDAWSLPAEGTLDEFADLCEIFSRLDPGSDEGSSFSRRLFAIRRVVGERMGWDDETAVLPIPGCEEISLRERLPTDVDAEPEDAAGGLPFQPVYRTADEWALETSNSTVHAIMHLGWARQADDHYRGQMGVYVKPRGRLGPVYMAAIAPFRHYIVYPALMKRIGRAWEARGTC